MPPATIAVLAFDRISPFHLSAPCLVFHDGAPPEERANRLLVCAAEAGPLRTSAGFSLVVEHGLEALAEADLIIIPSWRDVAERPPSALLEALRAAHGRGAVLVGLCLGAYVLAEAELLDHRPATTHWAFAEDFARRHPAVRLDAGVLYVDDGDIVTSAGTVAAIDCCLHLVRRRAGAAAANRLARLLVTAPHRQGGQAQFIERPLPAPGGETRLAALLDWMRGRLDQPLTQDMVAVRAGMSRRGLARHFRQLTGLSVGQWLLAERLALARRLLEDTSLSMEAVAAAAGFGSALSFRQHFRRHVHTTPSAWRRHTARPML